MHTFTVGQDHFYLDGEPFRLISGAIHYFRVPRAYWKDRLTKLKLAGFNAVETYVAWNLHMPDENTFLDEGMLDLSAFLTEAQNLGLWAIVRPGPYICSEWDFGGLPWWLLKEEIPLRCADPRYLKHVEAYFDQLIPRIRKNLLSQGGNIIMMQVENEYGSYGDDQEYLKAIRTMLRERGVDSELFTSDGAGDFMLTGGTLKDVFKTANFGSNAASQFEKLREYQPEGPLMCTEYWNGWFDHWTEQHHSRKPAEAAAAFREILTRGDSLNCYMFHGGTNFGFMNGANFAEPQEYQPTVSSYDDDALLDECGDITEKYRLIRDVIRDFAPVPEAPLPPPVPKKAYGTVRFTRSGKLLHMRDALGKAVHSAAPVPMEKLGQGYGFTLYSTFVRGPREEAGLILQEVHDRAQIFVDGVFRGVIYRNDTKPTVRFAVPEEGLRLDILVENMGRINYGPHLRDPKGITEGVRLGQQFLYGWEIRCMPMTDLTGLPLAEKPGTFDGLPVFLEADFDAGEVPADTFVYLPGFRKGIIFINGKPLSRYWEVGPQRTAYLPAPLMHPGFNTLMVLELEGYDRAEAQLRDRSILG